MHLLVLCKQISIASCVLRLMYCLRHTECTLCLYVCVCISLSLYVYIHVCVCGRALCIVSCMLCSACNMLCCLLCAVGVAPCLLHVACCFLSGVLRAVFIGALRDVFVCVCAHLRLRAQVSMRTPCRSARVAPAALEG